METLKENKSTTNRLTDIKGKWRLTFTTIGSQGNEGFGGKILNEYKNPLTGRTIYRPLVSGQAGKTYMVDQLKKFLHPDTNPQDRLDIEWLIHHPKVAIEGYDNVPAPYRVAKNQNSQIKLVALDFQEMKEIIDEDYIDKLVGTIVMDLGKNALSHKKLRHILAELNVAYIDRRFIDNASVEKKALRSKLKAYIRSNLKNAKKVDVILQNMEHARITYQIKELIRFRVIEEGNGMYKYNGSSIGISIQGIKDTWNADPDLKVKMIGDLDEQQLK